MLCNSIIIKKKKKKKQKQNAPSLSLEHAEDMALVYLEFHTEKVNFTESGGMAISIFPTNIE